MRRNPFDDLEEMLERVSQQFEEGMGTGGGFSMPGSVAVDLADTGEAYVVTADLPGYTADDIDLTLSDGTLHLEAAHEDEQAYEDETYIRRERSSQSVSRRLRLPEPVDESAVSASHKNGVLTVELPKETGGEEAKTIDIE